MKHTYTTPVLEILTFDTEDVITTSYQSGDPDDGTITFPIIPLH